jgi:hypothetical protein
MSVGLVVCEQLCKRNPVVAWLFSRMPPCSAENNGAADQLQLDTYGELMQTVWLCACEGDELDRDYLARGSSGQGCDRCGRLSPPRLARCPALGGITKSPARVAREPRAYA